MNFGKETRRNRQWIAVVLMLAGCNSTNANSSIPSPAPSGQVTFTAQANFTAQTTGFRAQQAACSKPLLSLAPLGYQIAVKSFLLNTDKGAPSIMVKHGKLTDSEVLRFTPAKPTREVATTLHPVGTYVSATAEVYYIQVTIPVDGQDQTLRVYFSDDDFPSESPAGLGPHHQGDVTLIDKDGQELGWVHIPPNSFTPATPRPSPSAGSKFFASDPDAATGHDRGPFGNNDQWKDHPARQPFAISEALATPLVLEPGAKKGVTMILNVQKAWEFTDEDCSGTFNPAAGQDASSESAGWAPVMPTVQFK